MGTISNETLFETFRDVILVCLMLYGIYHEDKFVRFERRFAVKCKKIKRKIKRKLKARCFPTMFCIKKEPGYAPERLHQIPNNMKAVRRELDADNILDITISKSVKMYYDSDGFAKTLPFCMTDEYADIYYYGTVIFCGIDEAGNVRSLTEKEAAFVEQYIRKFRADKD